MRHDCRLQRFVSHLNVVGCEGPYLYVPVDLPLVVDRNYLGSSISLYGFYCLLR